MVRSLVLCLALLFSVPTAANAADVDPAQDALIRPFFADLQAGRVTPAYEGLFANTIMKTKEMEVRSLIDQTSSALRIYGKVSGWEVVDVNSIAPSYAQVTVLVKAEVAPLFFKLDLYKPSAKWTVTRINFADNFGALPK